MSKIMMTLIALLCFFNLSCSDLTGESTGANEGLGLIKIGGLDAVSVGNQKYLLEGTASNGGNSGHNYRLKFKLPEGESLTFHFFVKQDLSNGANYTFTKESGVVTLKITLNGKDHTHDLVELNNKDIIDIDIDIHNNEPNTHMLMWNHSGPFGDNGDCTDAAKDQPESCMYNTEDFAFDTWLKVGKASGTFWGLSGDDNLVMTLEGPLDARAND